MQPLSPEFSTLPRIDPEAASKLRTYAYAALFAHVAVDFANRDDGGFGVLLEEASILREQLLDTAELLARFGLLSSERVAAIRVGVGHLDTASDLIALRALLGSAWPRIANKVPITFEQVERAGLLGVDLHDRIAQRRFVGGPESSRDDPPKVRARAFTLLLRKYDECRRAVSFLRWDEGDADVFAPSLYTKRRRRPTIDPNDQDTPESDTLVGPPAPAPIPELPEIA